MNLKQQIISDIFEELSGMDVVLKYDLELGGFYEFSFVSMDNDVVVALT